MFGQKQVRCDFGQSEMSLRGLLAFTQIIPDLVPEVNRCTFFCPLLFRKTQRLQHVFVDRPADAKHIQRRPRLQMQGVANVMLVALAGATKNSFSDDIVDTPANLLASIVGANCLLVASTSHDMRAGYSLLVEGLSSGHHVFSFGLSSVYGIRIFTAMLVLLSTSDGSASVVLYAVAVLFIADLERVATRAFCAYRLTFCFVLTVVGR